MTQVIKTIEKLENSNLAKSEIYQKMQNAETNLIDLTNNKIYKLTSSWTFDANNASVTSPERRFYLTQKEILFLKMLIKDDKITTYKEMISILWNGKTNVSLNAVRLFTKDLKKKLPQNILKNFQDIGYKLVL